MSNNPIPTPADRSPSDRDQDVVTYRVFAGLRNDVDPERFDAPDLAYAVNCDLDKSGRLARRSGYASVLAGASHSLWSWDDTIALFMQGSTLYRLNPDYSKTALAIGLTSGLRMSYWRANSRVYFSNGIQTGIWENGTIRSWGLPVPALPGCSLTVGSMPAGTYQYVATYFRSDGQESGAGVAGSIAVPEGGGLIFNLPDSTAPGVTSKGIYLTTPNGDILFQALVVPQGGGAVAYQGDTSELSTELKTQFAQAAPGGQKIAYYRGYMLVADDATIYPSLPYAYELFDLRRFIPADSRVTMLAPMEDKEIHESEGRNSGLFIGTDRSCGVLVGSDPSNFQYVPKLDYGAIDGAVDYVDGALFESGATGARPLPMWLTTQGICVGMPGMEIRNLTRTKYGFTAAGRGAAMFQPGPNRFVAVSNY